MKLLYVVLNCPPEPMAADRPLRQLIALRKLGYEVTVLTTFPSYPRGRVYPGYRGRLVFRETLEGLSVVRVWSLTSPNSGFVLRAVSFISFLVSASLVGLFLGRPAVVMAAVPSPGTELAGLLIARVKGSAFVLEMIDLLPDNLEFLDLRGGLILRLIDRYYRFIYRKASAVAVVSVAARDVLVERGVAKQKIVLLPNAADPDVLDCGNSAEIRRAHGLESKFLVVYAGSFSRYYQIPNLVNAAEILMRMRPDIHFLFIGDGPDHDAVRKLLIQRSIRNVTLIGALPRSRIGGYLQAADLFLYSLVAHSIPPAYHNHISAKACDYLFVGRPIIAVENGPVLGPLLTEIGAGVSVAPKKPFQLAKTIAAFQDAPDLRECSGRAGRSYARRWLIRQMVMSEFDRDLRAILNQEKAL
jgi:colanic acid biosynthesis glycosyl transferase WcaI